MLAWDPNHQTASDLLLVLGSEAAQWSDSTTHIQSPAGNQVLHLVAASCLADASQKTAEAMQCALKGLADWQAGEGHFQAGFLRQEVLCCC